MRVTDGACLVRMVDRLRGVEPDGHVLGAVDAFRERGRAQVGAGEVVAEANDGRARVLAEADLIEEPGRPVRDVFDPGQHLFRQVE